LVNKSPHLRRRLTTIGILNGILRLMILRFFFFLKNCVDLNVFNDVLKLMFCVVGIYSIV